MDILGEKYRLVSRKIEDMGELCHESKEIRIQKGLKGDVKLDVILHEVVHAIIHELGHRQWMAHELEEHFAEMIPKVLMKNFSIRIKRSTFPKAH